MSLFRLTLAIALHLNQALPILPEELHCRNSSLQLAVREEETRGILDCDAQSFSASLWCCDLEDVWEVRSHVEHTVQFGQRHLDDRQEFLDRYSQASFGDRPCAPVAESLLAVRLQKLDALRAHSEDVLHLVGVSSRHFLCAACRGQSPGASRLAEALQEAEAQLAERWREASLRVETLYAELRAHDAAVSAQLRQAGQELCIMEFAESLRRGVPAPSSHSVPLRPWQHPGDGVRGFRELWRRWVDGLLAVSSEMAENLMAESQGILLAFSHAADAFSPARMLLAAAPATDVHAAAKPSAPFQRNAISSPALAFSGQSKAAGLTLLVAMPNPGTNLRFDFNNDPLALSDASVLEHLGALKPLISSGAARIVIATCNPMQAQLLQEATASFVLNGAQVRVVWRRFALFNADDLAQVAAGDARSSDKTRLVTVFQVPVGGDVIGLAKAAALLEPLAGVTAPAPAPSAITTLSRRDWPSELRVAAPSAWPSLLMSSERAVGGQYGAGPTSHFASLLRDYLEFHRSVRQRLARRSADDAAYRDRVLVYRCTSLGFCGGHGDRLNGLLGVLILAIVSGRAFFIDSPRPVPLHLLLGPRRCRSAHAGACADGAEFLLDWRMHGAISAVGRQVNYNDRFNDVVEDLPWLLSEEPEPVVVLHSNQRVTAAVLQSTVARNRLGTLAAKLLATPFLHAELFDLLFEPTPLLAQRHAEVKASALAGRQRLLAVHFRAGDRSPQRWKDPPRHSLGDLEAFLACAASVERQLGWRDEEVAWYLAADTAQVSQSSTLEALRARGKLAFLPAGHGDASIIHLDRSPMDTAVVGLTETWAQWLTIASSDAAVLSASNFGVTAAESGRLQHVYLGAHGCIATEAFAS
eukprot:TRINITY_DN37785_c0_g1_i2.p1 TRINITY_DN37785_c0_g1~~TRINITY_DN37785_c0_g1_i2.p1  ORF type:complete len:870 (-),score=123.91 TRINITY_DN37785_c0_g1_i2:26-2635(-)